MYENETLRSLQCLASNMRYVHESNWPKIVERFQDTLDLRESRARVSLQDNRLTLDDFSGRYAVAITTA